MKDSNELLSLDEFYNLVHQEINKGKKWRIRRTKKLLEEVTKPSEWQRRNQMKKNK